MRATFTVQAGSGLPSRTMMETSAGSALSAQRSLIISAAVRTASRRAVAAFNRSTPSSSSTGYAIGANVEVEVRHGRQCHASQTVALTYERGRAPTLLLLAGSLKAPIVGALTGRRFILSVAIS